MRKRLRLQKNNTTPKRIHILSSPKVQQLRKNHKLTLQRKYRAVILNKKLKNKLFNMQGEMSKLTSMSLEDRLTTNKIPTNQRVALHEILSASQVLNLKGRRYSEDWILLCLLFHMRSPCGYNFIRNNDIMPLPCVRTIRR